MNTQILHQFSKDDAETSRLGQFVRESQKRTSRDFDDLDAQGYQKLHEWSVEMPLEFYDAVWDFCGILGDKNGKALSNPVSILDAKFYPDARISFAENMLKRVHTQPDDPAIIERVAGRENDRILSWQDLYDAVSRWEQALEKLGIGEGDCVATYLPHIAEAYILMIAVSQRGAVFSSVGTEMGAQAAAARFEQIQPKILIAVDGYKHMAKIGQDPKIEDRISVVKNLQDKVSSLEHSVVIPNLDAPVDVSALDENTVLADEILGDISPKNIEFARRDFNAPLAILFSSGSTGQPKCFVHGVGGVILKHAIEHQLQGDVRASDRVFFHTTTSWMMFNWLASGLANEATIMIYDGNPAYPDAGAQLQFAADYGSTHLGTAAAIIQDVWAKNDVSGGDYDLSALRSLLYTGSVLSDAGFTYAHQHIKADMSIDGVCGGTDFVGCYAMGNVFTPTIAGALKGPVLGMAVDVWDDEGAPQEIGAVGELVVTKPFSSRPLYFLNDEGGERFRAEYFEYFDCQPAVWRHGDAVKKTHEGQLVVEGRSDSTLNQGGVRIGTQQLYDAITDADLDVRIHDMLAASFKDAQGGDHTALFLVTDKDSFGDESKAAIKAVISDCVGRLCVPHEIIAVPYVLKTANGKRAEKPTAKLLAGADIQAPETYGYEGDVLKADLYKQIGVQIREKDAYGFTKKACTQ